MVCATQRQQTPSAAGSTSPRCERGLAHVVDELRRCGVALLDLDGMFENAWRHTWTETNASRGANPDQQSVAVEDRASR